MRWMTAAKNTCGNCGRTNDLIAGEIIDPLEQRAPGPGRYALTDGRQTTQIDIRDAASRQRYLQQFTRKQQRLQRLTRQLSIAAFSVLNGTDTAAAVQRVFAVGRHTGRRRVQRPAMRARQLTRHGPPGCSRISIRWPHCAISLCRQRRRGGRRQSAGGWCWPWRCWQSAAVWSGATGGYGAVGPGAPPSRRCGGSTCTSTPRGRPPACNRCRA